MSSDAGDFAEALDSIKEFVDNEGRHFYIVYFEDGSGRVFQKERSEDRTSVAKFVMRNQYGKKAMRKIASATDFEFDKEKNTQQNFRNLMNRS